MDASMTGTTILVQNVPAATISVEADMLDSGAIRPASAAHLKVNSADVTTDNRVPISLPAGTVTPFYYTSGTAGTVEAGARNVTFANVGAGDATLTSSTLRAGDAVTFRAPEGKVIDSFSFDATGTTLLITGVR